MTYIPIPYAACNAAARIGSAVLYNTKWTVNTESKDLPTANMESGGFDDSIAGLRKATGTFEGWWDAGANMYDSPLSIQDGNMLQAVRLYPTGISNSAIFWSFPFMLVLTCQMTCDVQDEIKYSFTWKAKGQFIYPTSSLAAITIPNP
jgi:hypothetical protein